ncbi:MAG: type II toxin-antitoxin system HicB family antitoxin [Chloroflexota bacterium]|nr:type II toxin-antitoxin system HicB family antitoxin [Chloroflexota bacterium]
MLQYEIIIFWSDEDNAYIAHIPELPGCSAHGETYERALEEAQVAMSLWLDTAKEFGHPIPAPARRLVAPAAGSP